jgi:hypothetical protein
MASARGVVALLALVACHGQETNPLAIRVAEGGGSVVSRNSSSAKRLAVVVTDSAGRPAENVTVTFRLPAEGSSGTFPSGLRSESLLTGRDGRAEVMGIRWNDSPGKAEVAVVASSGQRRAEATIPVEISATLAPAATGRGAKVRGPGNPKKWYVVAGLAGGALAGLAVLRPGGSTVAAPAAVVVLPKVNPTIGSPVVVIGRPQ